MDRWDSFEFVAITWLGGSATVDCLLCLMLIVFLKSQKSSFQPTNDLLTKWVVIVLETGTLPAIVQILELSFYLAYKSKPYSVAINCLLPKTYMLNVLFLFLTILTNREARERSQAGQLPSANWKNKDLPRAGYQSNAGFPPSSSFVVRSYSNVSEDEVTQVGIPQQLRLRPDKEDIAIYGVSRGY